MILDRVDSKYSKPADSLIRRSMMSSRKPLRTFRHHALDKAVPLGMVLRHRHMHLGESLFNHIHHHRRPADEVLMVGIGRRQMPLEHLSGNEALLAGPAGRWIPQHVDDRQIKPRLQRL